MNIKLEIDGEKYEIALVYFDDPLADEWESDSNWRYDLYVHENGERVEIGTQDMFEDQAEAASAAMSNLIQILTNEDHSIEE